MAPVQRVLAVMVACLVACAGHPEMEPPAVTGRPPRSYFFGKTATAGDPQLLARSFEGCANENTCNPAFCLHANGPGNAETCKAEHQNMTDAEMRRRVSRIESKACRPSNDRRCSSIALRDVFGRFPSVKAAYCNDEFMVLLSLNMPSHHTTLQSIHTPPVPVGASVGGRYASQCLIRDFVSAYYVFKWPLNPKLLPTSSGKVNNKDSFIMSRDTLYTVNQQTSLPFRGPSAVTVAGVAWFSNVDGRGNLTWAICDVDVCSGHAGPRGDFHYHGDPFGPQCLYSRANYSGPRGHPPLVGYGLDGVPLFGRYLFRASPGFTVPLDDCGGHQHAGIDDPYIADGTYHYHAFVQEVRMPVYTDAVDAAGAYAWQGKATFEAYSHGPFMCWKGNISAMPNFWTSASPPQEAAKDWKGYQASTVVEEGDLSDREDYDQVRPCEGMTEYYAASGYHLRGSAERP